jgi:hypothetical protein
MAMENNKGRGGQRHQIEAQQAAAAEIEDTEVRSQVLERINQAMEDPQGDRERAVGVFAAMSVVGAKTAED